MWTNITWCNFIPRQERISRTNPSNPRIIYQNSQGYFTGESTGHCRNLNRRSRLSSFPSLLEGSRTLTLGAYYCFCQQSGRNRLIPRFTWVRTAPFQKIPRFAPMVIIIIIIRWQLKTKQLVQTIFKDKFWGKKLRLNAGYVTNMKKLLTS